MSTLGTFLSFAAAPLAKRVLVGLGVGVVSYSAVMIGVDSALDAVVGHVNAFKQGMPGDGLAIIAKVGVFHAMGMMAGGVVAGVALRFRARLGLLSGT